MFQSYATSKEFWNLPILIECKPLWYCARSFQIRNDETESCEETRRRIAAGRRHDCEILQATSANMHPQSFRGLRGSFSEAKESAGRKMDMLEG
jgi:hypothetical protein